MRGNILDIDIDNHYLIVRNPTFHAQNFPSVTNLQTPHNG